MTQIMKRKNLKKEKRICFHERRGKEDPKNMGKVKIANKCVKSHKCKINVAFAKK